jgi:secreted trypsin-like serine protease
MNLKAPPDFENKIINGDRADVGEFPFQAALGVKNLNGELKFVCGGSLIADDIILTAAHCVNKKDNLPTMVRLGRVR